MSYLFSRSNITSSIKVRSFLYHLLTPFLSCKYCDCERKNIRFLSSGKPDQLLKDVINKISEKKKEEVLNIKRIL